MKNEEVSTCQNHSWVVRAVSELTCWSVVSNPSLECAFRHWSMVDQKNTSESLDIFLGIETTCTLSAIDSKTRISWSLRSHVCAVHGVLWVGRCLLLMHSFSSFFFSSRATLLWRLVSRSSGKVGDIGARSHAGHETGGVLRHDLGSMCMQLQRSAAPILSALTQLPSWSRVLQRWL